MCPAGGGCASLAANQGLQSDNTAGAFFSGPEVVTKTFTDAGVSFSVWIKTPTTPGSCERVIDFGNGPSPSGQNFWIAFACNGAADMAANSEDYGSSSFSFAGVPEVDTVSGNWDLVVVTVVDTTMNAYVNGQLVLQEGGVGFSDPSVNISDPYIGASQTSQDYLASFYLDDFRMYKGALVYSEVVSLYESAVCPSNAFSASGRRQYDDCQCNAGYTGSGICTACEAGKYKNTTG